MAKLPKPKKKPEVSTLTEKQQRKQKRNQILALVGAVLIIAAMVLPSVVQALF